MAAAGVFVVGGVLAVRALRLRTSDLAFLPLLVAAGLVPVSAVLTALEYSASARILGHRVAVLPALRVTVTATAANLLPIPGGAVVRIQGLRGAGFGYGRATLSTALVGIIWVGSAALVAGVSLLLAAVGPLGGVFLAGGVIALGAAYLLLRRQVQGTADRLRIGGLVVVIEVASLVVEAARLVMVMLGLGVTAEISQSLVLAVSGVLASSVGIFPGGLGLREVIAAGLAPAIGLAPALGFLATGLNRVIGILVHAPIALAILRGDRSPS